MQVTEYGPDLKTPESERLIGLVAAEIQKGGMTGQTFCEDRIKYMRNVEIRNVEMRNSETEQLE